MTGGLHPEVKRLLDGEVTLADLPAELQAEGAEALRLLGAVDRTPVTLSPWVETRVMRRVREARARRGRRWRWILEPRVPPWLALVGAAAAALAVVVLRPRSTPPLAVAVATPESVYVRFVLYAPQAHQVNVAGTFNRWDPQATRLVRADGGVWSVTLALPAGEHQYAFVVDGDHWTPDPVAPAVDDGFGRRNSVLAVGARGERVL